MNDIRYLVEQFRALPAYTWPEGYPIVYHTSHGAKLCARSAQDFLDLYEDGLPATYSIRYSGAPVTCEECGDDIESAYGDLLTFEELYAT